MFERFTDRARRVLVLAQDEATALGHGFLGTEHILLGLLAEGEGVGAKALQALQVDPDALRERIVGIVGTGDPAAVAGTAPPFTPRAKRVLELALRAALDLGHNYIGTEHELLGLLAEGEGVAAQVLVASGLSAVDVRAKVIELLRGYGSMPAGAAGASGSAAVAAATSLPHASPAATRLGSRARSLAAGAPMGTHHYLLGLLEDPHSLAGRILESMGVTAEAVRVRVAELGTAGTTDELPKPKVPPVEVSLGTGVTVSIGDPALVEQAKDWVAAGLPPEQVLDRLRARLSAPPAEAGDGAAAEA
jgi:ATP-dependent Clp protease ATP-binding subunit ClpA